MKKAIHRVNVVNQLRASNGRVFTVTFIKKDGSLREMNCRLGVKKGVKFTGKSVGLDVPVMRVFDMQVGGFRSINLDTLRTITMNGESFVVTD